MPLSKDWRHSPPVTAYNVNHGVIFVQMKNVLMTKIGAIVTGNKIDEETQTKLGASMESFDQYLLTKAKNTVREDIIKIAGNSSILFPFVANWMITRELRKIELKESTEIDEKADKIIKQLLGVLDLQTRSL